METVPFRLNAKEYEVDGRKSFDFGVTASEINDKPTGNGAAAEIRRREQIKEEKYFIRIYINGNEVVKSDKMKIQWPSYKVTFNQKFSVIVYSAPSNIQV